MIYVLLELADYEEGCTARSRAGASALAGPGYLLRGPADWIEELVIFRWLIPSLGGGLPIY